METPRPSPRTNRIRRVPHPVLIGHAASLTSFELLPTLGALERASVLPAKDDAGAGVAGAVGRRMICRARAPPRVPTAAPPLAAGSGAKGVLRAGCPA